MVNRRSIVLTRFLVPKVMFHPALMVNAQCRINRAPQPNAHFPFLPLDPCAWPSHGCVSPPTRSALPDGSTEETPLKRIFSTCWVQVACWFIGKQQFGPVRQRPGYRHSLPLTAAQFGRTIAQAMPLDLSALTALWHAFEPQQSLFPLTAAAVRHFPAL